MERKKGNTMNTKTAKLESLLRKHAATIARTGRELAMNFDIPARDIIQMACSEMGISEKKWRELADYRASKEES